MAGRPREFDRTQALRQARDLFWANGYEGTSMADLVAALGLASARIYAAFGSKEALFREAVRLYETEEGGFADRALAGATDVRTALEALFMAAIALYVPGQRGCMVVTAATNCAPDHAALGQWLVERRRARTQSIIDRLEAARACGDIGAQVDTAAVGDCCAALLHGLSVQARDGTGAPRLKAAVRAFLSAFDRMVAPAGGKEACGMADGG